MIKAVLFDFGGVFKQDSMMSKDCTGIFGMTAEQIMVHIEKTKPIFRKCNKGIIDEKIFWKEFSEALGRPDVENCAEKYREIYRSKLTFFSEMFDLVKELKEAGIKTAVFSNILVFQADIIRENKGYECFDVEILSYLEGMEKPEPEFYALALKKVGFNPEECIFIDDKEKNLEPAKNLGIYTVLAKNPEQVIKDVLDIINLETK